MQNPHDRTEFQVERIAFFSDAVFAIAMTLMIIEVKPPHLHHHTNNREAFLDLLKLSPMFVGVVISFIFIGVFWITHHHLFRHITNYNPKLVFLNMMFLMGVIFIPFSTTYHFENTLAMHSSAVPIIVYNLNYIFVSFCSFLLFRYALKQSNGLCSPHAEKERRMLMPELIYIVFVFTLVIVLALIIPQFAPLGYSAFGFIGLFLKKMSAKVG